MATIKRTPQNKTRNHRPTVVNIVKDKTPDVEFTAKLDEAFRKMLDDPMLSNTDIEKLVSSLASLMLHYIVECSGDRVSFDLDLASLDHKTGRRFFLKVNISEELSGKDVM